MLIEKYKKYFSDKYRLEIVKKDNQSIIEGYLSDLNGDKKYAISNGIPRFANTDNYTKNFGFQWNTFQLTQFDSNLKNNFTRKRFLSTKWDEKKLNGRKVLEVGSGAGRFTELFLKSGAELFTFDYSNAIDANYKNNKLKGDGFFFQADIYDLPFEDNFFDYVFCYGVLQHTPKPEKAFFSIYDKLKPGGNIAIDWYIKSKKISPWSTPKYFWRPFTKNMDPEFLYNIIKFYIPLYLPIDTLLKKLFGQTIAAMTLIPCWNYIGLGLTYKQRKEWAILDTFDALGAKYDYPKTKKEVENLISSIKPKKMEVFEGGNGVVGLAKKGN